VDKVKEALINDILKLDKEIWIPMHQTSIEELETKSLRELTMYYNSLVHVRENPV